MFDDAVGCPGSVDDVGNDVPGTCIEVVPNAQSGSTLALASATIHIDGITVVAFLLRLDDSVANTCYLRSHHFVRCVSFTRLTIRAADVRLVVTGGIDRTTVRYHWRWITGRDRGTTRELASGVDVARWDRFRVYSGRLRGNHGITRLAAGAQLGECGVGRAELSGGPVVTGGVGSAIQS